MRKIKHRFTNHTINPYTEILILGTFNPDTKDNEADFFYGRSRNYLWRILPTAYNESDLKGAPKNEKLDFIAKHKIDLTDLILEVNVEEGQEANYYDGFIDSKVSEWNDTIGVIDKLPNLRKICFTRKTYSDIPNMEKRIQEVIKNCEKRNIQFQAMVTPARFYRKDKQEEWTNFLLK
jgi:G:T/U-mismatch repair DNA glycosylase